MAATKDGNALGGLLGEFLGTDLTAVVVVCGACDQHQAMAQVVVYEAGPGWVARCRGCAEVVLKVAVIREELVLDLRGAATLRMAAPAQAPR
ncbi:MAG: hypothetical protein J7518_21875 [Nocardioidaceae bacterium]|nr:hypothetical protein [Nocardioidaceae bacterium]